MNNPDPFEQLNQTLETAIAQMTELQATITSGVADKDTREEIGRLFVKWGHRTDQVVINGIMAIIAQRETAARIDENKHQLILRIDTLSSAEYKAGFNDALDQIDKSAESRIAALSANPAQTNQGDRTQ